MSAVVDRAPRRVGAVTALVGFGAAAVLAAVLLPWDPVPGGPLALPDPEAVLGAEAVARAEQYADRARLLSWSSLAVSLVVALALALGPWGRRLVDRAARGPLRRWWLATPVAVVAVLLVGRIATLPFAVLMHEHRRDAGLSRQAWAPWALDVLRVEAVGWVSTSLGLLVVVGLARRAPRAWPALVGGALAALVVAGSYAYPVLVEPVLSDVRPLEQGPLRTAVLEVAAREGVRLDDVLVSDASRRTTTYNAYVSGFGSTRRVVLWDTLVQGLPQDQALSVVAHELAHARHDDVLVGTAIGAAAAGGTGGLLGVVASTAWFRRRVGRPGGSGAADRPDVPAVGTAYAVPAVLALLAAGSLVASPVQNGLSRVVEVRADVVALETTQDPEAFVALQVSLARASLADPEPPAWSQWAFGSHPTLLQRVALAGRVG